MVESKTKNTKSRNENNIQPFDEECLSDHKLPIDKGWAWVILCAATASQFILMGQVKCFGIIFVQLQKRYNSSSSQTAIIPMIQCAVFSVVSFLVMTVGQKISCRYSVLIGAMFGCLSSFSTAFTTDINIVYVTLGVGVGLAHAFIMPQTPAIVSLYFNRRRGFANNVSNSGSSLGGLTLAPLVTLLFEYYGFTGTFIILTGFNLNILVIGTLLRPLEFYQRVLKKPTPLLFREDENTIATSNADSDTETMNADEKDAADNCVQTSGMRTFSPKYFKTSCFSTMSRMFNRNLLSKPLFHYFLVCNVFLCSGFTTASAFLPPHATEMGASDSEVAWIVITISIVDFLARFLFGWLTDKHWCKRTTLLAVSSGVLGTSAFCLHFMTTYSTIMIYAVIAGLFQGLYFSLYVVIILDFLSMDEFKAAIGFTSLIQGVSTGICYMLLGYIRDVSGNYLLSFDCLGIMLLIGGVMIFFLPKLSKHK